MGRRPLLSKQQVIAAIQRSFVERGMPPSIEELRRDLQLGSARTVLRYLRTLEEDGAIERGEGARAIRLRKVAVAGLETRAVPLVGEVPAGPLMVAEENLEGWVRLPRLFMNSSNAQFFLLRVRGDSMNRAVVGDEKIEDGDLVLVRQQATAESGDIVVALIDREATIKRLQRAPGYWVLQPNSTNTVHRPIVATEEFRVQGVVQKVLKKGAALVNTDAR